MFNYIIRQNFFIISDKDENELKFIEYKLQKKCKRALP